MISNNDGAAIAKKRELDTLEDEIRRRHCLPHLYAFPLYEWQLNFLKSRHKFTVLCAPNQIGKSAIQIIKCIRWATEPKLWPKLWKSSPTHFWYFYPDSDLATEEFNLKWIKKFLPRDEYKDHPQYGWTETYGDKRKIYCITFNTGVVVYFKTYTQKVDKLQGSTLYASFGDEEMPMTHYDEVLMRLEHEDGYFHLVYTSTLDEPFWADVVNEGTLDDEDAYVQQVELKDCLKYVNSDKPTPWTQEKIDARTNRLSSQDEVDRRVHGKAGVSISGIKYDGFNRVRNYIPGHKLPKDWLVFSGVDIGAGGKSHKSAIAFIGVAPDYKQGRIFFTWREDFKRTTAGDVLVEYRKFKYVDLKVLPVMQSYDWAAADFGTMAQRSNEAFTPADKSQQRGEDLLNTLFKTGMLKIYHGYDSHKLVEELEKLKKDTKKSNAKDDLIDAVRFAVARVPWDYETLIGKEEKVEEDPYEGMTDRERSYEQMKRGDTTDIGPLIDEYDEANYLYGVANDEF